MNDLRWNAQELIGTDSIARPQGVNMHVLYHCRLQDVRPFVFKRGWYWEGLPCVLVLRPHEGTLRCHLVLAVHSSGDHAAPRPIWARKSCAGEVPTRPKLILLPEATVRDEYCHWLPSLHLQDRLGTSQDSVHEGQHDVHPYYCGINHQVETYTGDGNLNQRTSDKPANYVRSKFEHVITDWNNSCFLTVHQHPKHKFFRLFHSVGSNFGLKAWCLVKCIWVPFHNHCLHMEIGIMIVPLMIAGVNKASLEAPDEGFDSSKGSQKTLALCVRAFPASTMLSSQCSSCNRYMTNFNAFRLAQMATILQSTFSKLFSCI